jgi:hypothetical protein
MGKTMITLDTSCFFGLKPISPGTLEWYDILQQEIIARLCIDIRARLDCIITSGYDAYVKVYHHNAAVVKAQTPKLQLLYEYEPNLFCNHVPFRVELQISNYISHFSKEWEMEKVQPEFKRIPNEMCNHLQMYNGLCTWCVQYKLDEIRTYKRWPHDKIQHLKACNPCFPFAYQFLVLKTMDDIKEDGIATYVKYEIDVEFVNSTYEHKDAHGNCMTLWVNSLWDKLEFAREYELSGQDYSIAPAQHST